VLLGAARCRTGAGRTWAVAGSRGQRPSKHGFHCGDRRYSLSLGVMPGCPTSAEQTLAALLSVREVLASLEVFGGIHVCRFTLTARGLPRSWDEIGPGHLVIAQESLEYGWWEAIVLDRKGDSFTLQ
jgi:hypothetical protein